MIRIFWNSILNKFIWFYPFKSQIIRFDIKPSVIVEVHKQVFGQKKSRFFIRVVSKKIKIRS